MSQIDTHARGQFSGLRPAQPGNDLAAPHGGKVSTEKLVNDPKTLQLAEDVKAAMPVWSESD